MQSNEEPLMMSYQNAIRLYDADCLLEISPDVAHGYLVLLSSSTNDDSTLAFASLTDGNVLDTCFGCHPQRPDTADPNWRACREAKAALSSAASSGSTFSTLAVATYFNAFSILIQYHDSIRKMNFCFRCFLQRSKRQKAKNDLTQAFGTLSQAIASSA